MTAIRRMLVLASIAPVLALGAQAPAPGATWPTATPAEVGLDAAPLDSLHAGVERGEFGMIDRFVVVKDGRLVVDHEYPRDYRAISDTRRTPVGCGPSACNGPEEVHQFNYLHPDFHPYPNGKRVHSLQSVTKSVTAVLVGIAIDRGELPGVDAPVLSLLRDWDTSAAPEGLREATLEDVLTMRLGLEWHEGDRPAGPENTTFTMELSDNWVAFTLRQPMLTTPGDSFSYNSGASHLLSAIMKTATGMPITEYAERHLFGPLGITDYHWKVTPEGLPDTEGGLYLEARDLARIGQLYLNRGRWGDRQVVSEGWVRTSTDRHVTEWVGPPGGNWGYGYKWWRLDHRGTEIWTGLGFGGQFLFVLPAHDVVAVFNAWNLFGPAVRNMLFEGREAVLDAVGAPPA